MYYNLAKEKKEKKNPTYVLSTSKLKLSEDEIESLVTPHISSTLEQVSRSKLKRFDEKIVPFFICVCAQLDIETNAMMVGFL